MISSLRLAELLIKIMLLWWEGDYEMTNASEIAIIKDVHGWSKKNRRHK